MKTLTFLLVLLTVGSCQSQPERPLRVRHYIGNAPRVCQDFIPRQLVEPLIGDVSKLDELGFVSPTAEILIDCSINRGEAVVLRIYSGGATPIEESEKEILKLSAQPGSLSTKTGAAGLTEQGGLVAVTRLKYRGLRISCKECRLTPKNLTAIMALARYLIDQNSALRNSRTITSIPAKG
jgi:hypothetical protein